MFPPTYIYIKWGAEGPSRFCLPLFFNDIYVIALRTLGVQLYFHFLPAFFIYIYHIYSVSFCEPLGSSFIFIFYLLF